MPIILFPHVWIMFITSAIAFAVGVYAWGHRKFRPAAILSALMVCVSIWSFSGGIEAGIVDVAQKIFWSKISYIGFVFVSPLAFLFILNYTNRLNNFQPIIFIFLGGISLITLLLVWTNESHGLIWSGFRPGSHALNVLIYNHGIWYWVFISIHYALFTIALLLLAGNLKKAPSPYKQQIIAICLATLIPAFAGAVYLLNISPIPGLDWSPISTVFTGLIFAYSIFHHKFLDLIPIAREALVDQMQDGMLVLDEQQRIIDINSSARAILAAGKSVKIGSTLASAIPELFNAINAQHNTTTRSLVIQFKGEKSRFVDVRFSFINEDSAGINCTLLLLRDITKRKIAEMELNNAHHELEIRIKEIESLQNKLKEEAIRDPLTGLYNRRFLDDALLREFARAQRENYPVGIAMLDIDHFKNVNDSCGHLAGDIVLQRIARMMVSNFRLEDVICRFGGEEFLIVMPNSNLEPAMERIEKFCKMIRETTIDAMDHQIQITISAGVAAFPENGASFVEVIQTADQSMYKAKEAGRNRVIAAERIF